jgi:hypothetical protein
MREMLIRGARRFGVALVLTATIVAPAQVANAAGEASPRAAWAQQVRAEGLDAQQARLLQSEVDKIIAGMKTGGHQISANEVMSDDGRVKVTVPVPGEERARALSSAQGQATCEYNYLCLYAGRNWTGSSWWFWACEFHDLGDYGWNDNLESYFNDQSSGSVSKFYNWQGSWVHKFGSTAPHSDNDLNRTGLANIIDGVTVC